METTLAPETTADIFNDDRLDPLRADEIAMDWQDSYLKEPTPEIKANLAAYSQWARKRKHTPFANAEKIETRRRIEKETQTLSDWEQLKRNDDAAFDHVARRRGIIDGYEKAAELIPRDELRAKVARDMFVQDITGAAAEELRTGIPQLQVAKQIFGIEDPSEEAFDEAMVGFIGKQVTTRDRRERMRLAGEKFAITKLSDVDAWSHMKQQLAADNLSPKDMEDSARTLHQARERARDVFGNVIPVARRVFATVAGEEGTRKGGLQGFSSIDEAAEAFAKLPEEDYPKMVFALAALAEEHGEDLTGFFNKVGTALDRGAESYGISLGTFMRGRQAQEFSNRIEKGDAIFIPVEEGDTPREAALNAFRNLATGQGIEGFGLGADRGKDRRELRPIEREYLRQHVAHIQRLQSAKQAIQDHRGVVAKVESENMVVQGVYDATGSLPYMGMAFLGPIGHVVNGAVMSENNFRQLKASNPDVDDNTLRNVADAAAVPQALIERFQARTLFGNFPGSKSFLSKLAGGGFVKQLTVRTGLEFSQEMAQEAMLPIAQKLLAAIDEDVPDIDLSAELGALAKEAPRIFFAVLPLTVIGAGTSATARRFRGRDLTSMMRDEAGLRLSGLTEQEAAAVASTGNTEDAVKLFQETWQEKTPEQRLEASKAAEPSATREASSLPVIEARTDGKLDVAYPDGTRETVATEEEAATAHGAWVESHFEAQRRISEEAIGETDLDAAFEEESARFAEARPGVAVAEVEGESLGDLRRRGLLTVSEAWGRVKDYAAQTGISLEGFTATDFDSFKVAGSASTEARFVDGVLEGAITIAKGEKNVATLWEEQSETYITAQLAEGGTWTDSELAAELRKVERQTGQSFLSGESRANLIEGFSFVARNYAAGNYAEINFGQKLKHVLNLIAEKMAAVFTLAKGMRQLTASGELSPALETAIRESLGFDGNQDAEMESMRIEATARLAGDTLPAVEMNGKGQTLSITRAGDSLLSLVEGMAGAQGVRAEVWKRMAAELRGLRDRADTRAFQMAGMAGESLAREMATLDLREESETAASAAKLASDLQAIEERREAERSRNAQNLDRLESEEAVALQDEGERLLAKWGEDAGKRRMAMAEARKTVAARFVGLRAKEAARHRAAMKELAQRDKAARREAAQRNEKNLRRIRDRERDLQGQADRFDERAARFELLQDIATLEAIAKALPLAVRGKVVGDFKGLASLRSTSKRQEYLVELLPKVERVFESYLRKEFRTAIRKQIKKGAAKISEGRNRSSSIGAIAAGIFEEAKDAMRMADDTASTVGGKTAAEKAALRSDELTLEIENAGEITAERLEELVGRLQAVELLGDFPNATSNRLAAALDFLSGAYTEGRAERVALLLSRREVRESRVAAILKGLGVSQTSETAARVKRTRRDEKFLKGLSEGLMGVTLSGSQTMRRLRETTTDTAALAAVEDMENAFTLAEMAEQDLNLADNDRYVEAAWRILGVKSKYGFAKRLSELRRNTEGNVPVTKIEGFREETVSIPIRHVEAILNGDLDAMEAGGVKVEPEWRDLSEGDLTQLEAEWELFNDTAEDGLKNKRTIRIKRKLNEGERKSLGELSQLEGLNWLLILRQPDQAAKLEGMGWDAQTVAELEAWLKPEVKALGQWMVADLLAARATIEAIHREEKGIGLAILDGPYFPVTNEVSAAELESLALDGLGRQGGGRSVSSLKMRVPNNAEPAVVNALAVYLGHKAQMNFWKANVGLLREWGGIIKDDRFAAGVKNSMGSEYYAALKRRLERIENGGSLRKSPLLWIERVFKSFVRGFALGTLGGRVSTLAVNTAAFANVTLEVPITELLPGMRDVMMTPAAFKDAWNSPAIRRRLKGGATFEAQLAKQKGTGMGATMAVLDAAAMPAMEAINIVDTGANTVAAAFVWERTRKAALGQGATDAEARAAADRKVEIVMARAAQPTLRFARSEFELTLLESPLALPFAMFMSEARKTTSIGAMAMRQILTGKGSYTKGMAFQQAIMALVVFKVIEQTIRALVGAATKGEDDDEETFTGRAKEWLTDPKAWMYALTADHLTAIPGLGEAGKSGLAATLNSDGANWIVTNTMPADFAARWQESEARYFDANPNPLAKVGKGVSTLGKSLSPDLTAEDRAAAIIDSTQVFGTLIPGAAVAAQVANVGETALGTFNTFGGSLSEDDKVKLLKTRYSSLQKELEELHGSSMRNTGKHDDQGKPRKQLDKEVAKAKHTALADRLIMDLAPLSPELREAALDAIAPPETIRKAVQKAFLPK